MDIYQSSFRSVMARLDERSIPLSGSVLGQGIWTIVVNPRPLCVFRIRFHGASGELTVHRRRPFIYRELLRQRLDAGSLDEAVREVLALVEPEAAPARRVVRTAAPPAAAGWPALMQFGDLRQTDFERHPVWIACHVEDYGQPWYEQTDEETFRPWTGSLPVSPSQGMFLVRATARCRDGTTHAGFLTPAFEADLGHMQPHVFVGGQQWGFWGGVPGVTAGWRQRFYEATGKEPEEIFPLVFAVDPGLSSGLAPCQVDGFYWLKRGSVVVER